MLASYTVDLRSGDMPEPIRITSARLGGGYECHWSGQCALRSRLWRRRKEFLFVDGQIFTRVVRVGVCTTSKF